MYTETTTNCKNACTELDTAVTTLANTIKTSFEAAGIDYKDFAKIVNEEVLKV
jgi:predicted phosphoribosyltransferase